LSLTAAVRYRCLRTQQSYHYYASKEALFEAVVRTHLLDVLDRLTPSIVAFEGRYAALLRAVLTEPSKRLRGSLEIGLLRALIVEDHRFPRLTREIHDAVFIRSARYIEGIVAAGVASGEFRHDAHRLLPVAVLASGVLAALLEARTDIGVDGPSETETQAASADCCPG